MKLDWDTVQQVIRIVLYAAGGAVFGDGVTSGAEFEAAAGGVLAIGAFAWWYFWNRS